jgi:hypothetical protein
LVVLGLSHCWAPAPNLALQRVQEGVRERTKIISWLAVGSRFLGRFWSWVLAIGSWLLDPQLQPRPSRGRVRGGVGEGKNNFGSFHFWPWAPGCASPLRGLGLGVAVLVALWTNFSFQLPGAGHRPGSGRFEGSCFGLANKNSCNVSLWRRGPFQNRPLRHRGVTWGSLSLLRSHSKRLLKTPSRQTMFVHARARTRTCTNAQTHTRMSEKYLIKPSLPSSSLPFASSLGYDTSLWHHGRQQPHCA